jgi:hypothetical protein
MREGAREMTEERLHEYLSALPYRIGLDHSALLAMDLPDLFGILGYGDSTVFFEFLVDFSQRLVADAIIAGDRTGVPRVVFEVRTARSMVQDPEHSWDCMRSAYAAFMAPETTVLVLFSPLFLGIAGASLVKLYRLASLTREQTSEIYALLRPAEQIFEPVEETVTCRVEETFDYD